MVLDIGTINKYNKKIESLKIKFLRSFKRKLIDLQVDGAIVITRQSSSTS